MTGEWLVLLWGPDIWLDLLDQVGEVMVEHRLCIVHPNMLQYVFSLSNYCIIHLIPSVWIQHMGLLGCELLVIFLMGNATFFRSISGNLFGLWPRLDPSGLKGTPGHRDTQFWTVTRTVNKPRRSNRPQNWCTPEFSIWRTGIYSLGKL